MECGELRIARMGADRTKPARASANRPARQANHCPTRELEEYRSHPGVWLQMSRPNSKKWHWDIAQVFSNNQVNPVLAVI
jgi:uncharacterized Zn-finger protein